MLGEGFEHDHEAVAKGVHHAEPQLALHARVVAAHLAPTTGDDLITRVDLLLGLDVLAERVPVLGERPPYRTGLNPNPLQPG
jgi:hypothetical protein